MDLSLAGLSALKSPAFAKLSVVQWFSTIGYWVQRVAGQWLAWELTHSYQALGTLALFEALLLLFIMPLAGAVADRADRILIARYARLFALLIGLLLALFSSLQMLTMSGLIALMMLASAADGVWMPLRWAMVPALVSREQLTSAISIGSVLFNFSQFAGPALAGIIIVAWGVPAAFSIAALLLIPLFIVLCTFPREGRRSNEKIVSRQLLKDITEAGRYTLSHKAFSAILMTAFFASLCIRSLREFFAGFADDLFQQGAQGLAALNSAMGLGAFCAAMALMLYGRRRGLAKFVSLAMLSLLVAQCVFVSTSGFNVALACATVLGFAFTATNTSFQILMQNSLPDEKRGRVMSLWATQVRCAPAIGAYLFGGLSIYWAITDVFLASALVFACFWIYLLSRHAALKALED